MVHLQFNSYGTDFAFLKIEWEVPTARAQVQNSHLVVVQLVV